MRNVSEIIINGENLKNILEAHREWLNNNGGKCANLSYANLSNANLRYANLSYANLSNANLSNANLHDADLHDANLSYADLRYANLSYADLHDADLHDANLSYAILRDARNIPNYVLAITCILPAGDIIGWKKCNNNIIVKMKIPANANRSNSTGRKCRAEYVKVLALYAGASLEELSADTIAVTDKHGPKTEYQKGKTVKCNQWDNDRRQECSGGIHFFTTRYEAENY